MIHRGFSVVRFAAVTAILCCCIQAQSQAVNPSYKKWLDCDIDWIIGDSTVVVGPEFSIKLSFQKRPVTAVRLMLGRGWTSSAGFNDMGVVATAETDSQGIARFFAIPLEHIRQSRRMVCSFLRVLIFKFVLAGALAGRCQWNGRSDQFLPVFCEGSLSPLRILMMWPNLFRTSRFNFWICGRPI